VRATDTHRAIDAVWRIEQAKLIAGLARMVRDVGLAESWRRNALVVALEKWPATGIPDNRAPGYGDRKNRAIDGCAAPALRAQASRARARSRRAAGDRCRGSTRRSTTISATISCASCSPRHPVLSTEAQVALTLRLLGGPTTEEIARAFLVSEPTVAQ
jgi:predicted RNA polymerase sigma factor